MNSPIDVRRPYVPPDLVEVRDATGNAIFRVVPLTSEAETFEAQSSRQTTARLNKGALFSLAKALLELADWTIEGEPGQSDRLGLVRRRPR